MKHPPKGLSNQVRKKHVRLAAHVHAKTSHHGHSPFFLMWELITIACVMLVGEAFLFVPLFHVSETAHHQIESAVQAAEFILIVEVALLILIARDKIKYIRKNWITVLAALPFGGSLRFVSGLKIAWHAFEKTRMGEFLHHPIQSTRRWVHMKLGLRV